MIRSHLLNLVVFSALVAVFFAFLTQTGTRNRLRVILILGGSMVVLSLVLAYVMYPFPLR
jgi:amino acid permease